MFVDLRILSLQGLGAIDRSQLTTYLLQNQVTFLHDMGDVFSVLYAADRHNAKFSYSTPFTVVL